MIAMLVSAVLAQAAYVPPVEREPDATAQAWFIEDQGRGVWCAFTDRSALDRYAKTIDANAGAPEHRSGYGWVRLKAGAMESVTFVEESEDAVAEDRYRFDSQGKALSLKRTGHYINAPWATFTYAPDAAGRLKLDKASRRIVSLLNRDRQETYFADWSTLRRIDELPFYRLIAFANKRVSVNAGCIPSRTARSRG